MANNPKSKNLLSNANAVNPVNKISQLVEKKTQAFQTDKEEQKAQTLYKKQQSDSRLFKASLIPRSGEDASQIKFMFNPTDLSLSRSVSIKHMEGARTEKGLPKVNFGFVEPYKLTLAGILFDTYETRENVLEKIKPLLDAVDFSKFKNSSSGGGSSNMRRPPVFYFIWGDKIYMCCMVKQLDYKLTLFLPDGTPVRAIVTIALEEVDLGAASKAFSQRQEETAAQPDKSSPGKDKSGDSSRPDPKPSNTSSGKPTAGGGGKPTAGGGKPTAGGARKPTTGGRK